MSDTLRARVFDAVLSVLGPANSDGDPHPDTEPITIGVMAVLHAGLGRERIAAALADHEQSGQIPGDTVSHVTLVRIPGLYDLGKLIGRPIAIRVNDQPPQWTGLAQYLRLDGECTTSLTLTEPITVPWPTPRQQARLEPPTQFRLIADVLLVRRLDGPHIDDDTAVVW